MKKYKQESPFSIAQELEKFLRQEKILPCPTLLDIAGSGVNYLSDSGSCEEIYLADISQKMLELAREKENQSMLIFLRISQEALIKTNKNFQVVFSQ